jgi:hypothetical protein
MPRTGSRFDIKMEPGSDGKQVIIVTGGAILNVRNVPGIGFLDIEADRIVIWTRSGDPQRLMNNLQTAQGETTTDLEFYMSGHVEIRQQPTGIVREQKTLQADEIYYDVNRNVAVALKARLELRYDIPALRNAQGTVEPLIVAGNELFQLGPTTFEVTSAEVFSSKLPSDPGLKVLVAQATLEERRTPMTTLFGRPVLDRKTGEPVIKEESIVTARNTLFELENVPIFYLPYVVTDAREPLGPLRDFSFGFNRIFGVQTGLTLDGYKLFGLLPYQGTSWRLNLDYMSYRGPGLGSSFDYGGNLGTPPPEPPVLDPYADRLPPPRPPRYEGYIRLYGIHDRNFDWLGGLQRENLDDFIPPGFRGRALWRQEFTDLPYGFMVQSQVSLLSDRNFLEQYFKREFDTAPNQDTYVYVKQQQDNWAWYGLVEPRLNAWVTQTEWLPRFDGYLLGQDLFERFTYNAWASASYAQLRLTNDPPLALFLMPTPPPYTPFPSPTDQNDSTGRAFLWQELSLPLQAGPLKVTPYVKGVAAAYNNDLDGQSSGRLWGGGGVRGSIPFTRLYPDVQSELFNLNGINHKIVLSYNYFYASANEPHTKYPQLDRLNDENVDQSLRDIKPWQPVFNPGNGLFLVTSQLFDPQIVALRRLVDNRIDTLDTIEVAQFDLRQRWQTKRGYPGAEHIIDYIILDTGFSYYPAESRDNFGKPFGNITYNFLWNIGDRTAIESTGWLDAFDYVVPNGSATGGPLSGTGPYVVTFGAFFNRPDRTNFYIGYRQIEPLQSRAVTAQISYTFSPKYAMMIMGTYDFGIQSTMGSSILFTRIGTDLTVSVGVTYNALQNTYGALFEIVPNLVPANRRVGPVGASSAGGFQGR